jgi:hypothetical protein
MTIRDRNPNEIAMMNRIKKTALLAAALAAASSQTKPDGTHPKAVAGAASASSVHSA